MTDLGYILARAASRNLPRWLSGAIAFTAADLYTWTHPHRARAVDLRLVRALRDRAPSGATPTARDTNRAFARVVRDFLAGDARTKSPRVRLTEDARAILLAARASGRSTVLVSGHFGPWEVALRWLAREVGAVDALAAAHRSSAVERLFAAIRASYGVRTLSQGRPAAAALARLRAGGWIAVLADRERGRRAHPPEPADALVRLDPAPLLLARRARAQVLAGVAWLAPDGVVEVRFHPAFTLQPRRGGIALLEGVARLQTFFDEHVRAHPTQWFDWGPARANPGLDPAP